MPCGRTISSVVRELKAHRRPGFVYVFSQADGSPITPGKMKAPLHRALRKSGISRPEGQMDKSAGMT